jgi:hypothetical protein
MTDSELRQSFIERVVICDQLDGVAVRVLFYLSGMLNFDEHVHVPQAKIAAEMLRDQGHISRAIRMLVESGALIPGPEGTRGSRWRLNPDFGR